MTANPSPAYGGESGSHTEKKSGGRAMSKLGIPVVIRCTFKWSYIRGVVGQWSCSGKGIRKDTDSSVGKDSAIT